MALLLKQVFFVLAVTIPTVSFPGPLPGAAQPPAPCVPHDDMARRLAQRFQEQPIGLGVTSAGGLL